MNKITAIEYNNWKCEILYEHISPEVEEQMKDVKDLVCTYVDDDSFRNIQTMSDMFIGATVRQLLLDDKEKNGTKWTYK